MSSDATTELLRVSLLGPLRLTVDGAEVDVPGAKRRAVLAVLALADGATVGVSELIDAVWPDDPPERARAALQSHISRVRAHLGPAAERLAGGEHGYRLTLEPGELDVHLARDGLDAARTLANSDPAAAAARLEATRELWRGRPLAELDDILPVATRVVALAEVRRRVDALLVDCALAAGDTDLAQRAASRAMADDPMSEPAIRLGMRALAADGRSAEALRLGADLREHVRDQTGLDPTRDLAELERAIASGAVGPVQPSSRDGVAVAPWSGPRLANIDAGAVPVLATPIVGRESELATLRRLLEIERLVSIVGTGGVGKTRLAIDVARRHDDDVHFVALAPVTDADAVPHALAAALGLESARGDVLDACARLLAAGQRLLVLDNCEHVLTRAREVVDTLLQRCPDLTVLTTTRQRLELPTECAFRLGPLAVPEAESDDPAQAPAVTVFLDRARRARPDFDPDTEELAAAVDIVRRLEGVPLAIELAAGRLASLAVGDLRDRLDRALDLLQAPRSAADARHQTLRATIGWSYGLLPADRQRLVRHLAVFPDGVDLDTAEQVAAELDVEGDPTAALAHLVDASMLEAQLDGSPRYRMLETLRAFGLERLDSSGERADAEDRLLRWAVELTSWVDDTCHSADEPLADARLRRELANLRAAWALAMRRDEIDTAVAVIIDLDDAAQWREFPEVWEWAQQLAEHPALDSHPRAAAALATASDLVWLRGQRERSAELAEAALACAADDEGRGRALIAMAVAQLSDGRFAEAASSALEAAKLLPRPSHAIWLAALTTAYSGDLDEAVAIYERANDPQGITPQAEREYTLAEIASIAGRHAEAEDRYHRAIELATSVGSSFVVGIASVGLLTVLRATGRRADALRGYRDVLTYWLSVGNWIQVWTTLRNLADLLVELDDLSTASTLIAAADHDPDAAAVGDSAWEHAKIEPSHDNVAGGGEVATREQAVDAALDAIDRHLR